MEFGAVALPPQAPHLAMTPELRSLPASPRTPGAMPVPTGAIMPSTTQAAPFEPLVQLLRKQLKPQPNASPEEQLIAQREAAWLANEWPHLLARLPKLPDEPPGQAEVLQRQAAALLADFFKSHDSISKRASPPRVPGQSNANAPRLVWPGKAAHDPGRLPPPLRHVLTSAKPGTPDREVHLLVRAGSQAASGRHVLRWPVQKKPFKMLRGKVLTLYFDEFCAEGRSAQKTALEAAETRLRECLAQHAPFQEAMRQLPANSKRRLRRELKGFVCPEPAAMSIPTAPRQQWEAQLKAFLSDWQFSQAAGPPLQAGMAASLAWELGRSLVRIPAAVDECRRQMWLKAPFVRRRDRCLRLNRLPAPLWAEVLVNPEQRAEWAETDADAASQLPSGAEPPHNQPDAAGRLVLDTRHFGMDFRYRLEAALQAQAGEAGTGIGGEAIHGDNAQALRLLAAGEAGRTSLVYIDPPFNLERQPDFHYRVRFQPAEWLRLLRERLQTALPHLREDAVFFMRCDYHGAHLLRQLAEEQGLQFRAEILIDRSRNRAGSAKKMEVTYDHLFLFTRGETALKKFTLPRSAANLKWTGFLMPGERRPRERQFLGKSMLPPAGQHWALTQKKVERVQAEFNLRLRCRACGAHLYAAEDTPSLARQMKAKAHRHKFYDLMPQTPFFGTRRLTACPGCGSEDFRVQYLGADEAFVNDRWLDLPSYSRTWAFPTENAEALLGRVLRFQTDGLAMDFFAGSGTTAAVAQKLGRPWRVVEAGAHFESVLRPRLKRVLAGEQSGLSPALGWQGGGSFVCLRLESFGEARQSLGDRPPADPRCLHYGLDAQGHLRLEERLFDRPFEAYSELANGERLPLDLPATLEKLLGLEVWQWFWEPLDAAGREAPLLAQIARKPDKQQIGILWRNATGEGRRTDAQLAAWIEAHQGTDVPPPSQWLVNGSVESSLSRLGAEPLAAVFAGRMMAPARHS